MFFWNTQSNEKAVLLFNLQLGTRNAQLFEAENGEEAECASKEILNE
jgi:hypothetical protein